MFATCCTFYVPLFVILVLYWKIYQTARRRIHRRGPKIPATPNSSNQVRPGQTGYSFPSFFIPPLFKIFSSNTPGGNTKTEVEDTLSPEEKVHQSHQVGRFVARPSRGQLDQHGQHGRGHGGQHRQCRRPEGPRDDVQRGRGKQHACTVCTSRSLPPKSLKFNKPLHLR